ncbi:sigma-54-dependent transcriptional regulator [Salinibacter altiplanensis]|uniref:sigma-54-dependent transcriptional regulator n=1 Tax=Salinibacter altiplanensis TaxID=1803181 RepID=UPI000C9F29F0|nr:sigma-54 dependent transcriptional regulator [Salinibacter altiplanensis]
MQTTSSAPSTTTSPHILAVDDEVMLHDVFERLFPREGIEVTACSSGTEAMEHLADAAFDLVLATHQMPGPDGMELLDHIQEHHPTVRVILLSDQDNAQNAVRAMQRGAADYIPKPFSTDELVDRVKDLLAEPAPSAASGRLSGDSIPDAPNVTSADGAPTGSTDDPDLSAGSSLFSQDEAPESDTPFVGEHESIQHLKTMVPRVAQSEAPVFVHGESGTGKEILSRLIHDQSARADAPYVPINCAALPSDLVESHLFGHVEGAFTGAVDDMEGAFERADGGTLLLDEITEIDCGVQAKLLRVLQEQQFQKIGASDKKEVDVRIVATSNRDLRNAVNEGAFREDLYHRLAVFPLHVPPLRGRLSDIPLLAEHFVEKYTARYELAHKSLSSGLLQRFQTHRWPGNVRELENMIHRGVVMAAEADVITEEHVLNASFVQDTAGTLPHRNDAGATLAQLSDEDGPPTIAEMERKLILRTLSQDDVSQKHAAEQLGVSARTIRNKLQEYRDEGFSI